MATGVHPERHSPWCVGVAAGAMRMDGHKLYLRILSALGLGLGVGAEVGVPHLCRCVEWHAAGRTTGGARCPLAVSAAGERLNGDAARAAERKTMTSAPVIRSPDSAAASFCDLADRGAAVCSPLGPGWLLIGGAPHPPVAVTRRARRGTDPRQLPPREPRPARRGPRCRSPPEAGCQLPRCP